MNPTPIATYRIQLCKDFTLHDAAAVVPYLARLGISHLYTSPCQQATAGSCSGYDVVDPGLVSSELGGSAGHAMLDEALTSNRLRHMIDIVPNHMSIAGSDNPWWRDVLKHGQSSHYAAWFDVDWDATESHWPNRVLLPVLGDQFGRVLDAGGFTLNYTQGEFTLKYAEGVYPLEPSSTAGLLALVGERLQHAELAFVAQNLQQLPRPSASLHSLIMRRHQDFAVLNELLVRINSENPELANAIATEVDRLNNAPEELGALIELQNYRLAHWRAADLDLGYRRFFNINTLVGLRVELPEVFKAVHELPLQWLKSGAAHALRVDHPDGLRDPTHYMQRLRQSAPEAWLVVEKILAPDEKLPTDWPVDGTTGYDFVNQVQGLFVDPDGEAALTTCYETFSKSKKTYAEVAQESKQCVLRDVLGSEVTRLTSLLRAICERHWRHRDHTRAVLSQALVGIAVQFSVYRTYVRFGADANPEDRKQIEQAVAAARNTNPQLDEELLQFIQQLLLMEVGGTLEEEFALRFQQLTGPAMAKGIEDTAFYRYFRLIALNEVGGDPARWGCSVQEFHRWCADAQASKPYSLLATSTHDTKRSEDVRARLLVLSEVPKMWADTSKHWCNLNARHRGELVDANTEYLYYQTLVGAWPVDVNRISAFMEKAVRESKVHTNWATVNEAYETELRNFISRTMADRVFVHAVEVFVRKILCPGRLNSLAQTLIKLTAPGVPDLYQGCELWDLSLVDPDNRRPVDFAHRVKLLAELEGLTPGAIIERIDEGLPKLWLITEALRVRQEHPDWFGAEAAYEPIEAAGAYAAHLVAFMRAGSAITVVPRLYCRLPGEPSGTGKTWGTTVIHLPQGSWSNRFEPGSIFTGEVQLTRLLAVFPVALLVKLTEQT
ncbi:MAG: malto-oligosyltrehalose synthase [Pseudomonadota bacterium]